MRACMKNASSCPPSADDRGDAHLLRAMNCRPIRILKEEITMLQIGKMNTLTVVEIEERGAWLAAGGLP